MPKHFRPKLQVFEAKLERVRHSKGLDLTGRRFGSLVVIAEYGRDKWQCKKWECICDCGGKSYPTTGNLRSGCSTSCGCKKRDALKTGGQRQINTDLLTGRLARLDQPTSIAEIANLLFNQDQANAAKWASACVKSGKLERVRRGVYIAKPIVKIRELPERE